MTTQAGVVDAVIGIDTYRHSHDVEIATAVGNPIVTMQLGNDSAGFAQLLAVIAERVAGLPHARCLTGAGRHGRQ